MLIALEDGEENVFRKAYEVDLDSDPEDVLVDEPVVLRSPEVLLPYQQRRAMLLQVGQANRKVSVPAWLSFACWRRVLTTCRDMKMKSIVWVDMGLCC